MIVFRKKKIPEFKKCTCNRAIGDPYVYPKAFYGFGGWFLLLLALTGRPKLIVYFCLKCKGEVGRTDDKAKLEKFKDGAEIG